MTTISGVHPEVNPPRYLVSPPPDRGFITAWRSRIGFDPADVRIGDRIGWYTVTEVRVINSRVHGWPCRCFIGFPPNYPGMRDDYKRNYSDRNPRYYPVWDTDDPYPPPCQTVCIEYWSEVRCRCGHREIINLVGDRFQDTACYDCTRANSYGWDLPVSAVA